MMAIRLAFLITSFFLVTSVSGQEPLTHADLAPLLKNGERTRTNQITRKLLEKLSPHYNLSIGMTRRGKTADLSYHLASVIIGPQFTVKRIGDQIFVITSCRAHSCDEKGWIWIDAKNLKAVSGIIHYMFGEDRALVPRLLVFSNHYTPDTLPPSAFKSLEAWVRGDVKKKVGEVRFIDKSGKLYSLCRSRPCTIAYIFRSGSTLFGAPNATAVRSHCSPKEHVIFSCSTEKNKVISLCSSSPLTATTGYLQYRFGKIDQNPELIYPSSRKHPIQYFVSGTMAYSGGGGAYLKFRIDEYSYTVFTGIGKGWEKEGIIVTKRGKRIAFLQCIGPWVSEIGPALFENIKIRRDPQELEFVVP